MVNSINSVRTINIKPPQEYAKYEYEVEIDGKKQMACVEKKPNGKVTIKVGDGKDIKVIKTDVQGLMEFNKNYMPKDILYSEKPENKTEEKKEVYSDKLAQAMKNLAFAYMMIKNKSINNDAMLMDTNRQHQQAIDMAQQAHEQAMRDHMTAVQMTTPGMGII